MNTYHYRLYDDAETYVIRAEAFDLEPDGRAKFFENDHLAACILGVEAVWLKGMDGGAVETQPIHPEKA